METIILKEKKGGLETKIILASGKVITMTVKDLNALLELYSKKKS